MDYDIYTEYATDSHMYNSTVSPTLLFDNGHIIIVGIMFLIAFIAGTIGNFLVILAVLLSTKLRTATNAFVVNLSVADLLTALLIPWYALSIIFTPYNAVFSFVLSTTIGCSICTLAWIGLNRLLLITRPTTTYPAVYTPKTMAAWLTVSWLIPLLLNFATHLRFIVEVDDVILGYISIISAVAAYPIPLAIIIVSYTLIWGHIYRHKKRLAHERAAPGHTILNREQIEVTKNMFYVVCAFMLCLTPYVTGQFLGNELVRLYTFAILFLNSCINPLIYARKHRDFKTVFGCIFRRQWDKIPEPSDFLKAMRRCKCHLGRDQSA